MNNLYKYLIFLTLFFMPIFAQDTLEVNTQNISTDSLSYKNLESPSRKKDKKIVSNVSLSINTIPEQVEVFLDGNIIGKTPIVGEKITSGYHSFAIKKDGYAPISYDIHVNRSKSINLDFFMNPIYDIKFKTDETGLIFELNDEHRWTEKVIAMQLEAGDHRLRVYKVDEIIDEQIITADQPLTFQYYLKKGTVVNSIR